VSEQILSDAELDAAAAPVDEQDDVAPGAPPLAPDPGAEPLVPEEPPPSPPLRTEDLLDVRVRLTAELGRARLPVAHVVNLESGAIVDLDRAPEDPVDVYVNGLRYGSGRLVLVGDEWAVRLDEVVDVEQPSNGAGASDPADDYQG
jgi:flagellar motor switch protein FliN/FliY